MGSERRWTAAFPLALLVLSACGASTQSARFALRPPMWVDDDRRPFGREPGETYTPPQWDRIDHTLFRPLSDALSFRRAREAVNVNALDEVPSSSWFENRIGQHALTPARLVQGACSTVEAVQGPFTVTRAKPAGSSPGLVVRTEDGRQFLFKVDFDLPERGTAADAISTRIAWAAGYHTPCNRVVMIDTNDLVLATEPVNGRAPPSLAEVDRTLATAVRLPNGLVRASLSEFIEGRPLGGWRFSGRRADDPNDVIDHEDRRDVRGMSVLSAWLNHIDTRAENNLDAWIEVPGGRRLHQALRARSR